MKKQPWVPPPCKTAHRSAKVLSSKRHLKRFFLSHNLPHLNNYGERSEEYRQYFESDYLEILNNLATYKFLFYQSKDEIQDLNLKLNQKIKEISQLKTDLETEKISSQNSEYNLEILSNLVEKYETLNNVQHQKIVDLELKLEQIKDKSSFVDFATSPFLPEEESQKQKIAPKSTQTDQNLTEIRWVQTNLNVETNEILTQTEPDLSQNDQNIEKSQQSFDRSVQTDEDFVKDFDENKKKIKLLKVKLKSYKEKSTNSQKISTSSESSGENDETLKTLQKNFLRLKFENQKLKECLKFLKDSFRILYVEG